METGDSKRVRWPGDAQGTIGAPSQKLVLYWGWPTDGTAIEYTEHYSPLGGPKPMLTIKVAEVNSAKFCTVVPYLDPRAQVSFGRASK